MINNLLITIVMCSGLFLLILSYFSDLDLLRIKNLHNLKERIEEKTKIISIILIIGLLLSIITKIYVILLASLILAVLIPSLLEKRYRNLVADQKIVQWTNLIDDLSSGVRAGLTLGEALFQALNNSHEPLKNDFIESIIEFNKTGQISRVMALLEMKITDPVGRTTLKLIQVVLITGANDLATSLNILSHSSRENINLLHELKAKQSWVLNGARISILAPWLVLLALWTQKSVRVAYQDLMGQLILIMVAIIGLVGYFAMKRIGKIEGFDKAVVI